MFERYTPDTRKALFLAQQEALALDRPSIETEPLLIGVLRACPEIARKHLKLENSELLVRLERDPLAESANPLPSSPSRSSGLKLSQSTKRVLAYAAEESDR